MSRPGARRLLEAVKRKKQSQRRKSLLTRLRPNASSKSNTPSGTVTLAQTCLIQEKDVV